MADNYLLITTATLYILDILDLDHALSIYQGEVSKTHILLLTYGGVVQGGVAVAVLEVQRGARPYQLPHAVRGALDQSEGRIGSRERRQPITAHLALAAARHHQRRAPVPVTRVHKLSVRPRRALQQYAQHLQIFFVTNKYFLKKVITSTLQPRAAR